MEPILLTPAAEDAGARIDSFLAANLEGTTRSAAQKLIESGSVWSMKRPLPKTIS